MSNESFFFLSAQEAATYFSNEDDRKTQGGTYGVMPTVTNVSDSGSFYFKASAPNHQDETGSFTVTVSPASVTVTAMDQNIYVRDTVPSLSNPVQNTHYTVTGLLGEDPLTTIPALAYQKNDSPATPDNTTPGTYDIVPSGASAGGNYSISYTKGTLTINSKGAQTIAADDVTATYGDTDIYISASVTDPAPGGGEISYAVKDGSGDYIDVDARSGALTIKAVPPTDGKACVTVTAAETATHDKATKEVTVIIERAASAPATVTANDRTYDGTKQPLVTADDSTLDGGEMQYALGDENEATGAYSADIPNATDAGTYFVWYKVVGDGNHTDSAPACKPVNILNGSVTPEAPKPGSLVYNGKDQALVTAGKVEKGGTMQYALGTDGKTAPTDGWSEDVPTGVDAGTYYVWYKVLGDANHNDTDPASFEVRIAPKPLTVTADAKEKTYGDADPALTYTADGLVAGDKLDGALTRAEGEVAGSYAIRQGTLAASANYDLAFNEALFTIKPRSAAITARDQTITEGESIKTGVDQVEASGLVQGHALKSIVLSAGSAANAANASATKTIEVSGAKIADAGGKDVTANYAITYQSGKLTVNEKPEPEPKPVQADYTLLARLTVATKTSMKLNWTKVPGVQVYDVYFARCGKEFRKLDSVKASETCHYRIKGLKKRTCYKAYVKAWKKVKGKKVTIGQASPEVHAITGGYDAKYCNARSVKLNKSKLTLKVGKSGKLKATVKGVKSGKKLLNHVKAVRYYSSNTNVATVNGSGKVKAAGKGSCKIWAIAPNGVRASATVKVK